MSREEELKITKNKVMSYRTKAHSIKELLGDSASEAIEDVRIMHSEHLQTLQGIENCKNIISANLSSNMIQSIRQISFLSNLQVLDVKSNRILTLKGIEKCYKLIKLDASSNLIQSMQGINTGKNTKLEKLNLAGNQLADLEELSCLSKFKSLKQVFFSKGKHQNPFCQAYGDYILDLEKVLHSKQTIVDDQSLKQHLIALHAENQNSSGDYNSTNSNANYSYLKPNNENIHRQRLRQMEGSQNMNSGKGTKAKNNYRSSYKDDYYSLQNQELLITQQQRLFQTEQALNFKNEVIEQLKSKYSNLQVTQSQQYKQFLRKEAVLQKITNERDHLSKQLQRKDKSLSEMHKRVEDLLKASGQNNKYLQVKTKEIDRHKEQNGELKIQNAELKALNKEFEKRIAQLQEKTILTIQERTLKNDQIKRKYQDLQNENRILHRDQESLKDRVRELTELLRQWQYKYENKVNQLELKHSSEKEELIRDAEDKLIVEGQRHEENLHKVDEEMRQKVNQIQQSYRQSLQAAQEKLKKIKHAYDEKNRSEHEIKNLYRTALDKNQEQQNQIQEFVEIVMKTKAELTNLYDQRQHRVKQLNNGKYRHSQQIAMLEERLNTALYEKSRYQKELLDLRETYSMLKTQTDKGQQKQRQYEELRQMYDNVTTQLDAKNAMLEDKNDTIQSLKMELDSKDGDFMEKMEIRQKQIDQIKRKYENKKKECKEILKQVKDYADQVDQLKKQKEEYAKVISDFQETHQILSNNQKAIEQKDIHIQQLLAFVEKCKKSIQIETQEKDQLQRQYKRLETEAQRNDRYHKDQIRHLEESYRKKLKDLQGQNQKRKSTIQELQSVFMRIQK